MHFPQRISSIQSKVRQLHGQLQQQPMEDVEKAAAPVGEGRRVIGWVKRLRKDAEAFKCCAHRQVFYAQCLKLVALFAVAIAHLLFLHPFLELFSQLEKYAAQLAFTTGIGAEMVRHCVHDLADYKKNLWMTVAVMCIGLSISAFFLFFLPSSASAMRKCYIRLIGLIDLLSFGCLPILFLARVSIIHRVQTELGRALEQAHRLNSAEKLMNELQCTVHPRERLPYCSDVILRALFPTNLVKFLLVVCAMTLAYLAVAYIIYWCIKHWIPHHGQPSATKRRSCSCCAHSSGSPLYTPLGSFSAPSTPKFFAFSAPPPLLVLPNPLVGIPSEQCSPASTAFVATEEEPKPMTNAKESGLPKQQKSGE